MELVLDTREAGLIRLIPGAKVERLDLGDIQFKKEDDIVFIIERKTLSDLSASICDGRSREQKARLLNSGIQRERIMYLIEGIPPDSISSNIGSLPASNVIGSIINTQLRDGIHVYKTASLEESGVFILKLLEKMKKDVDDFWKYINEGSSITDKSYSATLKKKKKLNLTPNVWFIYQLSSIPQVTETISSTIITKYPTLPNLISEYERTPEHLRPLLVADLTYEIANKKIRKIGPRVSTRIYQFIFGIEEIMLD